jgi:hypothetical protein
MRTRLIILFLFISTITSAQTFDWWKNLVNWDGTTHWSKYIKFSPGFMGVNALPVPAITNGAIDSVHSFTLTGNLHFSKGDNSQNPTLYGNYCVAKNKVSVEANWVPVEWFQMSHAMKEKRKVYWKDYYLKKAHGDLTVAVNINLLNKIRDKIQLALRMGYRYASSDGVGAARMTNTPGYFFDVSMGKKFSVQSNWKLIAMMGFYVWQTNNDESRLYQDDAYLTGLGVEYNKNRFRLQTCFAGYFGYFEGYNDDPIVYRFNIEKRFKRNSWIFRFQQGLHNVHYSSFETGIKFNFGK